MPAFHELEAIGYPRGPEGLKVFRRQVNAAIPDEHIFVTAVRFEGNDIIEADLDISATHTGEEFMGIPATGRKIRFDVQARGRFVDDKMAERWDRADFEEIRRQLTGPVPVGTLRQARALLFGRVENMIPNPFHELGASNRVLGESFAPVENRDSHPQ
jgi:predicted ester cyclase